MTLDVEELILLLRAMKRPYTPTQVGMYRESLRTLKRLNLVATQQFSLVHGGFGKDKVVPSPKGWQLIETLVATANAALD